MFFLKKFIETIRYYCQGKGSPWHLILVWYFLLNIISVTVGYCVLASSSVLIKTGWLMNETLAAVMLLVIGSLGQIITFIYPCIFVCALWQCAFNVKWEPLGFTIRFLAIPFLMAHFMLGWFYFAGSMMMFAGVVEVVKKWSLFIQ